MLTEKTLMIHYSFLYNEEKQQLEVAVDYWYLINQTATMYHFVNKWTKQQKTLPMNDLGVLIQNNNQLDLWKIKTVEEPIADLIEKVKQKLGKKVDYIVYKTELLNEEVTYASSNKN